MKDTVNISRLESAVISQLLNNPELYTSNIHIFSRELFQEGTNHKKVFKAFVSLMNNSEQPDYVNLHNTSGVDLDAVMDLFNDVDFRFDFINTIQKLINYKIQNNLLQLSNEIKHKIQIGEDIFKILGYIKESIANNEISPLKRITRIDENIINLIASIETRQSGKPIGLKTGLSKYDAHIGGLQKSDLVIIAGETSQGKTSLALSMAFNAATMYEGRIAIFSLEMSAEQLTARLTSMETGISSKKILFYPLHKYDSDKISNMEKLPASGIYINDCGNSSIEYILSGIRLSHLQHNIQAVVVDYLQLVRDPEIRHEEAEISSIARRLKNIAKELDITVILLSQLNRDKNNPKPTLGRLRGSGQIEEAADIVAFIWRPETYGLNEYMDDGPKPNNTAGNAQLMIAKGRNYGPAKMYLSYDERLTYFTDCEYGTAEEPSF